MLELHLLLAALLAACMSLFARIVRDEDLHGDVVEIGVGIGQGRASPGADAGPRTRAAGLGLGRDRRRRLLLARLGLAR